MFQQHSKLKWFPIRQNLVIFLFIAILQPHLHLCQEKIISDSISTPLHKLILKRSVETMKEAEKVPVNFYSKIMQTLKNPYTLFRTKRFAPELNSGIGELIAPIATKTFNVLVQRKLKSYEFVGLTGNTYELGDWNPQHAIEMKRSTDVETTEKNDEMWTISVNVSNLLNQETLDNIEYRYFIGSRNLQSGKISIIEWENHVTPRNCSFSAKGIDDKLSFDGIRSVVFGDYDIFGGIDGENSTDFGWLQEHETIVQFKLFRNDIDNALHLKIIPIHSENHFEKTQNLKRSTNIIKKLPNEAIVQYTKLKLENELEEQPKNGVIYDSDDALIFHIRLTDEILQSDFLVNIYNDSIDDTEDSVKVLAYDFIKSKDLKSSTGELELNFRDQNGIEIEKLNVSYLVINSMKDLNLSFKSSFTNYWEKKWSALDVGHRGIGTSYKLPTDGKPPFIENTIASMKAAADAGADMVEFDIHLTKDLIPIIYHDFTILVRKDKELPAIKSNLVKIHLQDLTYEELKATNIYYISTDGNITEYKSHNEEENVDERLFPTLEEFFEEIDPSIGFDVEIKWPQQRITGEFEANQTLDKNLFADRILTVLLEKGPGRLSFLSSFDADLCSMLKFKQNMYPVMFLTMGEIHNWTPFYDPRTESYPDAVANAKAWKLFGIVAHASDLFKNSKLAELSLNLNQKVFSWGNDINSTSNVQYMKDIGMTGVIYDRVDMYNSKQRRTSIFKDDDSLKKLLTKQKL